MATRAILILCEGITEKIYFDSVIRNKRIAKVLSVEVLGKQGQHKALIKKCIEMIDEQPTKIKQAIANSNKLDNHTKPPFLTVQKLTARLLKLSK